LPSTALVEKLSTTVPAVFVRSDQTADAGRRAGAFDRPEALTCWAVPELSPIRPPALRVPVTLPVASV